MAHTRRGGERVQKTASNKQCSQHPSRRKLLAGAVVLGALASVNAVTIGKASARGGPPFGNVPPIGNVPPNRGGNGGGGGHCFLKGTMITTSEGERCIESLHVGDLVATTSGALRPVKWIGHWKPIKSDNQGWDWSDVPVKVGRGALDGVLPHRDLYVTDMHCLFIDGVLIPAIDLVNRTSIAKKLPPGAHALEYYHVELDDHDVVIANGAATESLRIEPGDRQRFDNGVEYLRLYGIEPDAAPACAPIAANNTLRKLLLSRIRTAIAPICDVRETQEIVRARLAALPTQEAA